MPDRKWSENNSRRLACTIESNLQYTQALRELQEDLRHNIQALLRTSAEQQQLAEGLRETAAKRRGNASEPRDP